MACRRNVVVLRASNSYRYADRFGNARLASYCKRAHGLEIAATCKIAELYAFKPLPEWRRGRSSANAADLSFVI